jgi:hypothetical protein
MAGIITPLSRRPRLAFLVLLTLLAVFLLLSIRTALDSSTPFPQGEWLGVLYLTVVFNLFFWGFRSLAITDYDPDYLYLFGKAETKQIPLGSFYKLKAAGGYWHLYYHDEQAKKRKLFILPLGTGLFFQRYDSLSIHGFIDAIWQHNPQLDVSHTWLK